MQKSEFSNIFKSFKGEFSKVFKDAFEKPMTKMVSEMQKNYKVLVQNLSGKKADYKDLVKIYNDYISGDEKELENSPHQKEFAEMKKYLEDKKKLEEIKSYIEANVKDPEDAKKLIQMAGMKEQSEKIAKSTGGDLGELEKMFSTTMTSILSGTKDFNSAMKSLVTDLENYFIKTVTNAIAKGLINSTVGDFVPNAMKSIMGFASDTATSGVTGIFGAIKSLFHFHSGGYIPRGTGDGFAVPGTAEYLSVLKGGERVLSPAEAIGYNSPSEARKNIIVNNFNVKAWDSKDVGQYLLDNKHLLANITYENIRNNNCSLRNIIGGI